MVIAYTRITETRTRVVALEVKGRVMYMDCILGVGLLMNFMKKISL